MSTDTELRDQAVAELKLTTVGYLSNPAKGGCKHDWILPPSGTHWANAMGLLAQIGAVTPPPSGNRLSRPPLTTPITVVVTNANRLPFQLDNTKDYVIDVRETLAQSLDIHGGRNVVVLKAHVKIELPSADFSNTGFVVRDGAPGRVVHLENILADGSRLIDAVAVACPNSTLQLQTFRLGPNTIINGSHSDGVQFQAGCGRFEADLGTIHTQYQGVFFGDHDGPIGQGHVTRCNIVGQPGKYLVWRTNPTSYPLVFEDCWMTVEGTPWSADPAMWVMPDAIGSYGGVTADKAVYDALTKRVSWPSGATTGYWTVGTPPAGDFVPLAMVA